MAQQSSKKPNKLETRHVGLVRAVPSGDTLQIVEISDSRASAGQLKEIQFTLMGLKAPSFGRRTIANGKAIVEKDQDFAFESREYLRKLVIGKCVTFRKVSEAGERWYGEAWLNNENLRYKIVQNGWADVITKPARKDKDGNEIEPNEDYVELLELKEEAEQQGIGKWQTDVKKAKRIVYRDVVRGKGEEELFTFFEKNRDKPLPGIVEQVRTGSTLRVVLTKSWESIPILLSGIKCPNYKYMEESACEPYSREAKFITEHYLLHRDVTVTVEGFDNFNNFFGTVLDSEGRNICIPLLQMGLATFVEWTAPKNASTAKYFREAERQAKEAKLRWWSKEVQAMQQQQQPQGKPGSKPKKDGAPATAENTNRPDSFVGKVVEIVNPGTITVRSEKDGKERKINFSSINPPRILTKKEEEASKDKKTPEDLEAKWMSTFGLEAKEYLRTSLIGEEVKCEYDYTRTVNPPKGSKDDSVTKQFWSVSHKGHDVAVSLVSRGFAKLARHAPDDDRSRNYQDLVFAEKTAQKGGKGIFGPRSNLPVIHKTDLTELSDEEGDREKKVAALASKATYFLTGLKRGKFPAVVEYVFSGSRFKLWIPSQSVVIFFSIAGVAVPRPPLDKLAEETKQVKDDIKFGGMATRFSRDRIYQRNVEVSVFGVDKSATFIGQITCQKTDLGLKLVEEGLGRLLSRTLDKLPNKNEYKAAQAKAQKEKKGIWYEWDEEVEKKKAQDRADERKAKRAAESQGGEDKKSERVQIEVTEILDGGNFCYQVINEESKALAELATQFQKVKWDALEPFTPTTTGVLVAAQFSQDDRWYRAEVRKIHDNKADVVYVDYGNTESVPFSKIRVLSKDYSEATLPRQAKAGRLAYIIFPKAGDEYAKDAAALFKQLVWGKVLSATIYKDYNNNTTLVVGDPENAITVNGALVGAGLARVEKRFTGNLFYTGLKEEEANARKEHRNIWQYGDIPDSDDEEN